MTAVARCTRARWARALSMAAAWACLALSAAHAQHDPPGDAKSPTSAEPRIVAVRAGFDGRFKVGYWTPFVVELEGGSASVSGRVELIAPDGDGVPSRVVAPAAGDVTIAPGERKTVPLYAKLGQLAGEVSIGFRTSAGLATARTYNISAAGPLAGVLPSSDTLVVSIGAHSPDTKQLGRTLRGVQVASIDNLDDLPSNWWGYEAVDAVILHTANDAISEQLTRPSDRLAALDRWVHMGGTLVVSVGRHAEQVLAAGSPLAALVPGTLESIVPLRQSSVLETYVDTTDPLASSARFELQVPQLGNVQGQVEAYAGTHPRDLPLVVRAPCGFGEVVFTAFDVDLPPVADWTARPQLMAKLFRRLPAGEQPETSGTGAVTTLGFVDLAGQLRAALDQFAGVQGVPFWLVALLITAYIACIGPLDYFLLKRVFRRMEATWITFGLTVVVFCAGAYALAYALKGRELRINEVEVVDCDAESGLVRGAVWSNVFSPANATYDVSLDIQGAGADSGELLSWFGLTGGGFGGMDAGGRTIRGTTVASRTLPQFIEAYDYSPPLDALEHVPIAVWSSKAFVGRWWRRQDAQVAAQLADRGKLTGTLTSRLDGPLTDAVLIYGKWAYLIGALQPGREIDIESLDPQTVVTYLRHVQSRGDRQVASPYDRASFDVPRIVEMMTAHDLAGGKTYTGLANKYEGFNELSGLVQNGRAVLLARSAARVAKLQHHGPPVGEGAQQSWTFVRFVFPVQAADSE